MEQLEQVVLANNQIGIKSAQVFSEIVLAFSDFPFKVYVLLIQLGSLPNYNIYLVFEILYSNLRFGPNSWFN